MLNLMVISIIIVIFSVFHKTISVKHTFWSTIRTVVDGYKLGTNTHIQLINQFLGKLQAIIIIIMIYIASA